MNHSSPIAAQSTLIPWRKRGDLQAVLLQQGGQPVWGLKDPITLGYFELSDEAYFVLMQLDGRATMSGVCQAFRERFRPRTLSEEELQGFLGQLLSQNLVLSELPGHGLVAGKLRASAKKRGWHFTPQIISQMCECLQ